jgi:chromosome segregation ATPase
MTQATVKPAAISVENIGGISQTEFDLPPGVTVLSGRNATNRTSLLRAFMAALGSEDISLKGDAEIGQVLLELGGDTYTRRIERQAGDLVFDGDPYLEDPDVADLFAFLLGSNEARRTAKIDGDLREVILDPVNVDRIQKEIESRLADRRELQDRLDELDDLKEKLVQLRDEKEDISSDINGTEADLSALEERIEEADEELSEDEREDERFERKLDELHEIRSSYEEVQFRIESQTESVGELEDELEELRGIREDIEAYEADELERIERQIADYRERLDGIDTHLDELQSVISFNEEMLDGTADIIASTLRTEPSGDEAVTDELLDPTSEVVCWTCGSKVNEGEIRETLERLRELQREVVSERNELTSEIDDLKKDKDILEERRQRIEEVTRRIEDTTHEIGRRRGLLEDLEGEKTDHLERIDELEAQIEEMESQDYSEVLELNKQANELEFEVERLRERRAELTDSIERIETRLESRADAESELEEVEQRLTELRGQIDRIQSEAIEAFNDHIAEVLSLLEYENLERIWIERKQEEVREGRRKAVRTKFELHVVRQTASGTTYEDRFTHLSESEREITGLIFALAGYLAHDVYDEVPFILLDSLESIDSERIATIVEYLAEYSDYLLVALLPEDARAMDDSYHEVTSI